MKLTDRQRSMIASAFVAAFDHELGIEECRARSLCCARDALRACAIVVGKEKAAALQNFMYESLGCGGSRDRYHQDVTEQYFIDKIAALETL